jgi:hypothetical protein
MSVVLNGCPSIVPLAFTARLVPNSGSHRCGRRAVGSENEQPAPSRSNPGSRGSPTADRRGRVCCRRRGCCRRVADRPSRGTGRRHRRDRRCCRPGDNGADRPGAATAGRNPRALATYRHQRGVGRPGRVGDRTVDHSGPRCHRRRYRNGCRTVGCPAAKDPAGAASRCGHRSRVRSRSAPGAGRDRRCDDHARLSDGLRPGVPGCPGQLAG